MIRLATRSVTARCLLLFSLCLMLGPVIFAQSFYRQRPADPYAGDAHPGAFGLHGDGIQDDSEALQAAINHVQESTGEGIVFLAEGRYRVSRTIYLWSGIRLIGYGQHRPVLVLGAHTPGYESGHGFLGTGRYMLQFASRRTAPGSPVLDANEFTFYSAVSNVDFVIGDGNPAAIAIRFHVAQHSFIAHSDIQVGQGRAGIEDVGNQAHDVTIRGGDYGILSVRTSPAWQFLLMDSHLSGQRKAAIHTEEVGMTLVRVELADTPVGVEISPGKAEQLYGSSLLLRNLSRAAVVLGDVSQQHHQVTLEDVRCAHVVRMLEGGEGISGWSPIKAPAPYFVERRLTLGQQIGNDGREGLIALTHHEEKIAAAPTLPRTDIVALPEVADWFNAASPQLVADGVTDTLAVLQKAIDGHRVVYLPSGRYRLSGTLHLRSDSVLIGLNPATTVLTTTDRDPAFMGEGPPVPLLDTPRGGLEVVTGIGIAPSIVSPRAAGIVWRGGPHSVIDDVNFPMAGRREGRISAPPSQASFAEAAKAVATYRGTQFPSLWIRDGGGALIRDVWTSDTMARAGWRVEDTLLGGIAYQVSCEHHVKNEVQFLHAAHWTVYALQTEEESPDGTEATALELDDAHDLKFSNLFDYRVSRNIITGLAAVMMRASSGVLLENMHNFSQTRLAFDNNIMDQTSGVQVRTHDFTTLAMDQGLKPGPQIPLPLAFSTKLRKIIGDLSNATGLTSSPAGTVFFTDSFQHKVYRWDPALQQATVLTEEIGAPQSATFVRPGTILVVDQTKRVYALPGDGKGGTVQLQPLPQSPETSLLLPVGLHDDLATLTRLVAGTGFFYAPRSNMAQTGFNLQEPRTFYYAPFTNFALEGAGAPASSQVPGARGATSGIGTWKPVLQAMQFAPFRVGQTHLVASEDDDKIYRVRLATASRMTSTTFAPRSATSVVEDVAGNVYVAGAQVFVYNAAGQLTGTLEVAERPSSLVFGGLDHRTLFIGARSGLYAIETKAAGLP